MKVNIIRSETVKPSTPTPQHLKTLKLSLLDQIATGHYVSLVLFYSNDDGNYTSDEISQSLKSSLSETLVSFYPLAGKINALEAVVDCDDSGATFVEADFDGPPLSTFLENRYKDESRMVSFLPPDFQSLRPGVRPLLVQVTFFTGGGFALGVAVTHKLIDGATLALFLTAWTKSASRTTLIGEAKKIIMGSTAPSRPLLASPQMKPTEVPRPDFESGPIEFPGIQDLSAQLTRHLEQIEKLAEEEKEWVTRRFVFDKLAIAALKEKTGTGLARPPSRVEAVTALVWKCAAAAAAAYPQSIIVQAVNMRTRVDPPFPGNAAGNLAGFFHAVADRDAELCRPNAVGELVGKLRVGLEEFVENTAKKLRGNDGSVLIPWLVRERDEIFGRSDDCVLMVSSSWMRFGFYEVDLGFGKPAYVAGSVQSNNSLSWVLMDTRDGEGVEIRLTLTKKIMASLESDPLFLAFVSKNNS